MPGFLPPADAGFGDHGARRDAPDGKERDRHHQHEQVGIGHDPSLQADPDQQRAAVHAANARISDLREPVAHAMSSALSAACDQRRSS